MMGELDGDKKQILLTTFGSQTEVIYFVSYMPKKNYFSLRAKSIR